MTMHAVVQGGNLVSFDLWPDSSGYNRGER